MPKTRRPSTSENGETVGQRVARFRRERAITQTDLARHLGVAQPVISDYERGELRLHAQQIVELARLFGVSADEILGIAHARKSSRSSSTDQAARSRRLRKRIEQIDRLPKRDQQALLRTIDAFLAKTS